MRIVRCSATGFRLTYCSTPSLLSSRRFTSSDSSSAAPKSTQAQEHLTLPLLKRPLGVREPPRATPKTWAETRDEILDRDKRMEKRRHLIKEASKGYFHDFHATRKHGGKTWIAPKALIREDKALYFPNIQGTSIDTKQRKHTTDLCTGHISVISMLSTKVSEFHTTGFTGPTNEKFGSHSLYRFIQINLQENILKSLLVNMFVSSIRKTVPPDLHPTYLVSSQNLEYLREPMGLTNSKVGYVYLVDEKVRIRWAGCGDAMRDETQALLDCTAMLLQRLEKSTPGFTNIKSGF